MWTNVLMFQRFLSLSRLYIPGKILPHIDEELLRYFVTHCQNTLNFKYQAIKLYLAGLRPYNIRLKRLKEFEDTKGADSLYYNKNSVKDQKGTPSNHYRNAHF